MNAPDAAEGSTYWIFTQNPNVQAFTDLLNRATDKPAEHVHVSGADDGPIQIQWMGPDDEQPKPVDGTVIEIEAHDPDKPQD